MYEGHVNGLWPYTEQVVPREVETEGTIRRTTAPRGGYANAYACPFGVLAQAQKDEDEDQQDCDDLEHC